MKLLGIARATRFSPRSESRDAAIFAAVAAELRKRGHEVQMMHEEECTAVEGFDGVFSMARSTACLSLLARAEAAGIPVVNSPAALLRGSRARIAACFMEQGIPNAVAAISRAGAVDDGVSNCGEGQFWVKRGDACIQDKADILPAVPAEELSEAVARLHARGITEVVVSRHVEGDLVKFYGVADTPFFHFGYPTQEGNFSKFGFESINGRPRGFSFDVGELKRCADRAAHCTGYPVYGGDCVVRVDGTWAIIDFNDWPSFSACREEAASAIAGYVERVG